MQNRNIAFLVAAGLLTVGQVFAQGTDNSQGSMDSTQQPSDQPGKTGEMSTSEKSSMSSDEIRSAQNKLNEQGYNVGSADGIMGKRTAQGIKKFQKDHDQEVTGRLDNATLSALGVQQAGQAPSGQTSGTEQQPGTMGTEQSNEPSAMATGSPGTTPESGSDSSSGSSY